MSKAYPCGAGLGLMGVSTDGDVALCHRFAGSDAHKLRHRARRHRSRQAGRVPREHHIDDKTDCSKCWARPICSGGCYHEAHTRYGDTTRPNLHYCDWIRGWTDICLRDLRRAGRAESRVPAAVRRSTTMKRPQRQLTRRPRGSKAADRTGGDVVALQQRRRTAAAARGAAHSARLLARVLAGLGSRSHRRHRRALLSRSSAISSTATSAATGRRRCRTSSITRPTGRPSAPRPRRTGARSTSSSRMTACRHAPVRGRLRSAAALAVVARDRAGRRLRARRGQGPDAHRRQRHALRRHLPGRVLDHRRGDREGRRQDPVQVRASRAARRCRAIARASTPSKRGWRRSRSSTSRRARRSTPSR